MPRPPNCRAAAAPTRPRRGAPGGNKTVSAAPGSRPGPRPGRRGQRVGRRASPANFTNLPGVSGRRDEDSQRPELRGRRCRPVPEALSPPRSRGRRWLCLYLVPILARCRCPNARTYTRVAGRCRRLPLLSLPLPSSCWPETHLASRSIPRAAANSPPGQRMRSCRRRPRHLRANTCCWLVCFPPPHCCPLPCTVPRTGCPRLFFLSPPT